MVNLMKMELKRNSLKVYVKASIVIFLVAICFIYLFAYLPHLEPNDSDMAMFSTYKSISTLICMLTMVMYAVLSSVMHSKLIVEEYANRAILLFSYPVKRSKIFLAKVLIIFLYTTVSMLVVEFLVFGLFFFTEAVMPLTRDVLTAEIISRTFGIVIIYTFCSGAIGVIAMRIGFIKKSVQTTIVSSIVISSVLCNILGIAMNVDYIVVIATVLCLIVTLFLTAELSQKVNTMEVR